MRKIILNKPIFFTLISFNAFMCSLAIPYMQKGINSHTTFANSYGIAIFTFIVFLLLLAFYQFKKNKQSIKFYLLLFIAVNLILWLPKIANLQCMGCSNGG